MSIERTTLPGATEYLRRALLDQLRRAGRAGVEPGRLSAPEELAADAEPAALDREIDRALAALRTAGLAFADGGRWYALSATDRVAGRVQRLDGGDLLIRSGAGGEAGYFVPRKRGGGAAEGDLVLVRPARRQGRSRPRQPGRLPEAEVVEILSRRHSTMVGTLTLDEEGRRWLVPFDPRVDLEVEVVGGDDLLEEVFVVVAVEAAAPGRGHPRGRVERVLGAPSTPGVDVDVVLAHHQIPDELPAEVLELAARLPENPREEDWAGREDLRHRTLVTIDGASARDFDDAISVERLGRGRFRLGVHIADVAHYVTPGSPIDAEAYRRGTSVYYPERAVPMLPERLSNGLCSLRPHVPRLTMSVFLDFDSSGEVKRRRFAATVIESARRLTYDEVRRVLEEPRPGDAEEYGDVLALLGEARELMEILHAARTRRGSIDFDLPEGDVILDTDGHTVGIRPGERHVAHRIIEEFMIAANEAVAYELESHDVPALYRVHEAPSPEDLEELRETLAVVGVDLGGEPLETVHPSSLQAILDRVAGHPEEKFVTTVVLRTMQRALYDPECRGHYALASRYYTHFTSPIRRYPDLVVHRSLKRLLAERVDEEAEALLAERLPGIAEHASFTERRAEQSERDLLQWKKVRFLAERVGEVFPGRITGVQPFGMFVQLEDLYVDGLVPIRALEDDFYVYEAGNHRLVGSDHGRVFRLADAIEVQLTGVSERHRGLDLVPADLAPGPGSRRGGEDGHSERGDQGRHRGGGRRGERRDERRGGGRGRRRR